MKRKKGPRRWDRQELHAEYGMRVWFSRMKVTHRKDQDRLFQMWLDDSGFKESPNRDAKWRFLQPRIEDFFKYQQKNIPLYFKYLQPNSNTLTQ